MHNVVPRRVRCAVVFQCCATSRASGERAARIVSLSESMNKLPLLALTLLAASTHAQFDKSKAMPPPLANKVANKTMLHGEELVDDYFWLREKTNPEVIKYLNLENAYTQAIMAPTKAFQ